MDINQSGLYLWYKISEVQNLGTLAWKSDELSRGQAQGWRAVGLTQEQTDGDNSARRQKMAPGDNNKNN